MMGQYDCMESSDNEPYRNGSAIHVDMMTSSVRVLDPHIGNNANLPQRMRTEEGCYKGVANAISARSWSRTGH